MKPKINIAVVDDHRLFRDALINLISDFDESYHVAIKANNGKDFIDQLQRAVLLPSIVLLDISMPIMDGFKTAEYLKANYPEIKILIITMSETEESLIRMLRLGVRGYIDKAIEPEELKSALSQIVRTGYYYSDMMSEGMLANIQNVEQPDFVAELTPRELTFVKYACSDDTYEQIAEKMNLSPKTIDGYRASAFKKFGVKSRVGLALAAIKYGVVDVS